MKKRAMSLILTAVILAALLPGVAPVASAAEVAGGTFGTGLSWSLDDAGVLTISGSGAMPDWTLAQLMDNSIPWQAHVETISSIVIGSGITRIGGSSFSNNFNSIHYTNLKSVTIPNGVASIGYNAFQKSGLINVVIPASVTSIETSAFMECLSLTSVTFEGNAPSVAEQAFHFGNSNLKIYYYEGKTGWTTPTWTPVQNNNYSTEMIPVPRYAVTVNDGTTDKATALPGEIVTITADTPPEGKRFLGWEDSNMLEYVGGYTSNDNPLKFIMPEKAVDFTAMYIDLPPGTFIVSVYAEEGITATGGGEYAPGATVTITAVPSPGVTFGIWAFHNDYNTIQFVEGTSQFSPTAKFTMPEANVTATAMFGDSVTDTVIPGDREGAHINLAAETITLPGGFNVAAYSVDGGKKWKKGALPTDEKKVSNLFNKDLDLWVSDQLDDSGKPLTKEADIDDTKVIKFPKIEARAKTLVPKPGKLAPYYRESNNRWVLVDKGQLSVTDESTLVTFSGADGFEYGKLAKGAKAPADGYTPMPADGTAIVETKADKETYLVRKAAYAAGGKYYPASKAQKISPAIMGKAPTYKQPTAAKPVLKLKKGDFVNFGSTTLGSATAKLDVTVVHTVTDATKEIAGGTGVTIWKAATGKKPASLRQTMTMPAITPPGGDELGVVKGVLQLSPHFFPHLGQAPIKDFGKKLLPEAF
ncbi:MAG: leucine-rich repeat protein [Oscillospiraceae bacterium]|nr:leucine-rich repeat protein [Oscillospiraceae bacterium]